MMTKIYLETTIDASVEMCFNLSRSIELHQLTTEHTGERAVAGRTSGLIEAGESVTWQAEHFFIRQKLTVRIVEMIKFESFSDEMLEGAFKSMWHKHVFRSNGSQTIMTDDFRYEVPFGIFGKIFNTVVLEKYMTRLLKERNEIIKAVAEGNHRLKPEVFMK
jgi:ligand-binding SRPBCC domain-containing protein